MKPFCHIGDVLRYVETHYDHAEALSAFKDGQWRHLSTKVFIQQVRHLALGLHTLGVKKGNHVGLLAPSSPEWTIADFAIMMAGGVSVPFFGNLSDEHFVFETEQTGIDLLFVAGEEERALLERHKERFGTVIGLDEEGPFTYEGVLKLGSAAEEAHPGLYDELTSQITSDDTAAIIYTSGSTGVPKGAIHTHANLVGITHVDVFHWDSSSDRYLGLLPLAHIFARTLNLIMVAWGIPIYYWNDLKALKEACEGVKPTVMIVVPRLLEKMYAAMTGAIHHSSGIRKRIGEWALKLAQHEKRSFWTWLKYPLANALVYKKLRDVLGGQMRVIISGGAHLNTHLNHFLVNAGFPVYEGWGLTEAGTVTVNRPGNIKIGTVGQALGDLEVKTNKQGEILVHGPAVMQGYFKNPEATERAFREKEWLHTGDKGTVDKVGFLTITGRSKELFKTAAGEYVTPIPIELGLCRSLLVDAAIVIAEERRFASCLLFPDHAHLQALKRQHKMEELTDEDFLATPEIRHEIEQHIAATNAKLDHWEEVHAYRFVLNHPTVAGGELTPTMKLKRKVIEQKYADLIEAMYAEDKEAA